MEPSSGQPHVPRLLELFAQVNSFLDIVLSVVAGACLGGFTISVLILVIFRQIIKYPLLEPFEITIFLFIWSAFTAGAVATKRRMHFIVDFLPQTMPRWFDRWIPVLVDMLFMIFSAVVLIYGVPLTITAYSQFSPMNQFRMGWAAAAIPVAGGAMVLFTVEHLLRDICGLPTHGQPALQLHGMAKE